MRARAEVPSCALSLANSTSACRSYVTSTFVSLGDRPFGRRVVRPVPFGVPGASRAVLAPDTWAEGGGIRADTENPGRGEHPAVTQREAGAAPVRAGGCWPHSGRDRAECRC